MNTNLPNSKLTKNQSKTFQKRINYYDEPADLIVTIRHGDDCRNGHNTFSITGDIYKAGRRSDSAFLAGGCLHDEIAEHMPELEPFIKWHLTSTDGPMHYVANSLYHARTTDYPGKMPGEPVAFDTYLKFEDIPFTFEQQRKGFWDYLDSVGDFDNIEVEAVEYDGGDNYPFSPNYSLTGFIKDNETRKWYKAPFKDKRSADEFLQALQSHDYGFIKIPTKWCEAVEPNLNAARNSAVWPDAELTDFTKEKLLDRLPGLMADFKKAVESLGLEY